MKHAEIILSKVAQSQQSNSFRTSAALTLTTLILLLAAATAQTYTDMHNFDGRHGSDPQGLAQGRDGNLYGTAAYGGTSSQCTPSCGVVFKITQSGRLKVLYNFDDVHGSRPPGGLTLGTDGNFYGTTMQGGADGYGTIFRITKSGSLTTLYSFTGRADGASPSAPPIQGADGDFYGTANPATYEGVGTAYKITSSGIFTPLASLPGFAGASLLQGKDGNFYSTTETGGSNNCGEYTCGTVFKITPNGVVTTVYNFDGAHGSWPSYGALIQGSDGNFYGTTNLGGSYGRGVAFKLTPQGAVTVLHNFPDPNYPNDGSYLDAGLVQATDGNFYGAASGGGTTLGGVIFQITPAGAYSILYNFDGAHGATPDSTPMQHTNGKIYGTTSGGGPHGHINGVVYSLDMGLAPFVSLVSTTRKIGKTVEILGQGFTGATAVSFNGTAATFTVVSDTYLTATVPAGATTGFVTVTTPTGTLTSNKQFRVKP